MLENVFNIIDLDKRFDGLYPAVVREKMPKINITGHFSLRIPLKSFSDKILFDNNAVHLRKLFIKNCKMRG